MDRSSLPWVCIAAQTLPGRGAPCAHEASALLSPFTSAKVALEKPCVGSADQWQNSNSGTRYCDVLCDYPQSVPSYFSSGLPTVCSVRAVQVEIADADPFLSAEMEKSKMYNAKESGEKGEQQLLWAASLSPRKEDTRCGAQYKEWKTRILLLKSLWFFWYSDLKLCFSVSSYIKRG